MQPSELFHLKNPWEITYATVSTGIKFQVVSELYCKMTR